MTHKTCPRCGSAFICQPENPSQCQCAGIILNDTSRSYLAEHYPSRCLCANCLKEIANLPNLSQQRCPR
ncbi:MAG: cysteine-rich CWC family protein [Paludibacteraceae bacterium]|nr:cysteine-rich CWC family protein [Paludibacteraceae bacterium]